MIVIVIVIVTWKVLQQQQKVKVKWENPMLRMKMKVSGRKAKFRSYMKLKVLTKLLVHKKKVPPLGCDFFLLHVMSHCFVYSIISICGNIPCFTNSA